MHFHRFRTSLGDHIRVPALLQNDPRPAACFCRVPCVLSRLSGARLLRSHRVPLPGDAKAAAAGGAAGVGDARGDADADAVSNIPTKSTPGAADLESGLAWLGGPPADVASGNSTSDGDDGLAVRVLLVDERLLGRRRRSTDRGKSDAAAGGAVVAGAAGSGVSGGREAEGAGPVAEGEGVAPVEVMDTEAGRKLSVLNEVGGNASDRSASTSPSAGDKDGHADTNGAGGLGSSSKSGSGTAAAPGGGGDGSGAAASTTPLLLAGLASLAEAYPREVFYSCSSGLGGDASSCASVSGDSPEAHHADAERLSENGQLPSGAAGEANGGDLGVDPDIALSAASRGLGSTGESGSGSGNGSWFSQEELLGGRVTGPGGDGSGRGGGRDGDEALSGAASTSSVDTSQSNGGPASGPARCWQGYHGNGADKGVGVDAGAADEDDDDDDIDGGEATTVAASTNGSSSAAEQSRSTSASTSGAGDHGDSNALEPVSFCVFLRRRHLTGGGLDPKVRR